MTTSKRCALWMLLVACAACRPRDLGDLAAREPGEAAERGAAATKLAPSSPEDDDDPTDACPPLRVELPEIMTLGDDPPVPEVVDPHDTLAPFYEKVAALLRGRATDHVRIGLYGDSNGTMDYVSGQMRRRLQTAYGDGGHGFVALARPWEWYRHRDLRHDAILGAWEVYAVSTHPVWDGYYGFGLIAAESKQANAVSWIATADESAPVGKTFDRLDVYYLRWPLGGAFDVKIDGRVEATVDTRAKEPSAGFHRIDVADAPHKVSFISKSSAHPVRLFGATLERSTPGIVVDGLGVGSLNCPAMLRDKPLTNQATLRHRKYDLVITHVGTNTFVHGNHLTCMASVIARHRQALPGLPVLVMTPPDHKGSLRPPHSPRWLIKVSAELREAARVNRAAFFDFREAMGGDGSIVWFQDRKMTAGDYVHLNEKGGAYMGDRVVYALWKELKGYLARHPRAGCD